MPVTVIPTKPVSFASVFNDFFEPWNDWLTESRFNKALSTPKVNITEDAEKFNILLGAPGMQKNDFYVNVEGNVLTISAKKEENKEEKDEKHLRQEYNYSSFSRSFNLPEYTAVDKIEASYADGVLSVILPKKEATPEKKDNTIPVK